MKQKLILLLVCLVQGSVVLGQNSEFDQWKQGRNEELLAEDGWVNLAGLLWISRENAFLNQVGKDSLAISTRSNKHTIGAFQIESDSVWFSFSPKVIKKNKLQTAAKVLQFPVEHYGEGGVYFDRWKWTVINRGGQFAMRLRDLNHPALAAFEPIVTYEYDSKWRLDAFFEPKFNEFINITNVMGQVIEWRVMGTLKFEVEGQKQELITLEDAGKLFVIFSDQTNGESTYPSGRYMYVAFPDKKGNTTVDFNYAYNPPCAYTAFATCPIPPKANRLDFGIEAGEKSPEGH
ncbi:DUF1684 domain-containing protein [Algoriphagus terrigena]|uniref:DUF1684 domain-containing protein n=1 Tax=Algoriphagus terrigena TaxID=344884 RepID=UPI0006846358|nr:DUF1684 domain-containing protein [Algoriphagus terrigena]